MRRICAWCGKDMGETPGDGLTHGICPECLAKELAKLGPVEEGHEQLAND